MVLWTDAEWAVVYLVISFQGGLLMEGGLHKPMETQSSTENESIAHKLTQRVCSRAPKQLGRGLLLRSLTAWLPRKDLVCLLLFKAGDPYVCHVHDEESKGCG